MVERLASSSPPLPMLEDILKSVRETTEIKLVILLANDCDYFTCFFKGRCRRLFARAELDAAAYARGFGTH